MFAFPVQSHEAKDCPLVEVQCPLGCAYTNLRKRIYWHRDHECPNRLVPCGLVRRRVLPFRLSTPFLSCHLPPIVRHRVAAPA